MRLGIKVCGGESQVASAGGPVDHLAAHAVRASKDLCGGGDFSAVQGLADPGRGPAAVFAYVINADDIKTVLFAELAHGGEVSPVVAAKAHVVANHHGTSTQGANNDLEHEFFGRGLGKFKGVADHQQSIESLIGEGLNTVGDAHDQFGRVFRAVDLCRVRVKADGNRLRVALLGLGDHCGKNLAVAAVHAIEVADRHYRRADAGWYGFKAFPIVHSRSSVGIFGRLLHDPNHYGRRMP